MLRRIVGFFKKSHSVVISSQQTRTAEHENHLFFENGYPDPGVIVEVEVINDNGEVGRDFAKYWPGTGWISSGPLVPIKQKVQGWRRKQTGD